MNKREILLNHCHKAKDLGYRVFVCKPSGFYYAYISDNDGRLCYIQLDIFNGVSYSTRHKPNNKYGNGFSNIVTSNEITKENIEKAFTFIPRWANQCDVVKWTIDERIQNDSFFKNSIIEL